MRYKYEKARTNGGSRMAYTFLAGGILFRRINGAALDSK